MAQVSFRALLALGALLLALSPAAARACGMPLDAGISYERALLIVDGPRQQLIASVDLQAAGPRAAVIFPVPGVPSVDQPPGGAELFRYLDEATRPLVEERMRLVFSPERDGASGGAAPGAEVLGRETIGGYDVARLAADDPQALQRWLDENGYTTPAAAAPILAAYVAEGWKFVAVRLADAAPAGSLAPLRISYEATEVIYPMRLGALAPAPVGVELFVLSTGRVAVPGLDAFYAGPLAALDPPPPPALAALLTGAPYLTALRNRAIDPATLSADFRVSPAPSDEPYREVRVVYRDVYFLRTALFWVLLCTIPLSSLSFGLSLAFQRRIRAIGARGR